MFTRLFTWVLLALVWACSPRTEYEPANGDVVFQTSRSQQSEAIQLATGSAYSHMGIVYVRDGQPFVFEAVQPAKLTPLREWVARGERGRFVAKRLRDAESLLQPETVLRMLEVGEQFIGRDYDPYFEWSDERIYCSELVWKVFDRGAGINIGALEVMGDFDLSHPVVRSKVRERFGGDVPLSETVISPAAIFAASNLVTVFRN